MFERLREERERLGLNQTEFGLLGGVQKRSQINYESGERVPDATYLAAMAQGGVDVMYVLTGVRSFMPPQPITPEHRALIADYDSCTSNDQAALRRTAAAMALGAGAAAQSPKPRKAGIYVERAGTVVKKSKLRDITFTVKGDKKK
ncbi:helix-turn-helix domain-containing protein [Achromobacter denitrificans]